MKNKNVGTYFVAASFALWSSLGIAQAASPELALELAIQKFNPTHTKALEMWGPEQQYMVKALTAVETQIPAVANVRARIQSWRYQELRFSAFWAKTDLVPATVINGVTAMEALTKGCRFSRETKIDESFNGSALKQISKLVSTKYDLGDSFTPSTCTNPIAKALQNNGVQYLLVSNEDLSYGTNVRLALQPGDYTMQDMDYVRSQLAAMNDGNVKTLAGLLSTELELMVGDGDSVALVGSQAPDMSTPFQIEYSQRWGDCPSGCTFQHDWIVEVTPAKNADGTFDFSAKVIVETGNPLEN